MKREIPVVMDQGALSDAVRALDPGRPSLGNRPPVFLRVADTEISEAEIAREMQHHRAANPHQSRLAAARALVVRELLRLEAERLGIDAGAEREDGETAEEATINALIEREVPTPQPDQEACRRWFENNRDRLRHPDRLRVRHILLAAAPADSAARVRAAGLGEQLIAELREHPERFTEFALRHSACPSRDEGGDLGWIERGDTTPEFDRQLFMLKPGLASLTLETRYGHHVVHVDEIVRGEPMSFEEAAGKIAAYLETQTRQNAIHQYLQLLRERYPVVGLDEIEALA